MSWFNFFSDAKELASEYIEDPDKRNEFAHKLALKGEEVYIEELKTRTIPWADAVHKLSRPIISVVAIIAGAIVIGINPEMDIMKLMAGSGPAAIYTLIKGKGK